MIYYAIQVKTCSEEKFIKLFKNNNQESTLQFYFPKRKLNIRKAGKIKLSTSAVFPGYVFIESLSEEELFDHQLKLRHTDGFYRFLKSNKNITPLTDNDLQLVLHFIKTVGAVANVSKVYFNENSRIVVAEGPLSGLEGNIIKIDKRKGRAKIKLDLFDDSFTVDLAFEIINSVESNKKAS